MNRRYNQLTIECITITLKVNIEHATQWLAWFNSSQGLILEKRVKSIMVICRATSSGSKSKIVSKPVELADGNCVGWGGGLYRVKCVRVRVSENCEREWTLHCGC